MNILVINVSLRIDSPRKLFPIGLGNVVTAMSHAGFSFDLLDIDAHKMSDEQIAVEISKKNYDVVCLGCVVTGYKIVKSLLESIREKHKDCKIIVGNSVATSIVDILFKNTKVDVAVMLEGEETIVDLLNTIQKGKDFSGVKGICFRKENTIVRTPPRPIIQDISSLPMVDFDLFDIDQYLKASKFNVNDSFNQVVALPVTTARGCIANCTFCYHVFKGQKYRYRNARSTVDEIKHIKETYGVNYVQFMDDLTFYSRKQTKEFVDLMIAENVDILWSATCRSNLFTLQSDIEIVEKMKSAGLEGIQYSLESTDADILKMMNKKCCPEHFSIQTELLQRVGITTWTSLVIGYPQETEDTIRRTFDVCIENNIYPSVGFLLPQPGSVMYDYAKQNGFIQDEEQYLLTMGDRQDLRINMTQMSDAELFDNVLKGLERCNKELGMNIGPDSLIKTKTFKKVRRR